MDNKASFHVSTLPDFWDKGLKKRYIAEPYVAYCYKLSGSDDVVIADFTRKNKSDYIEAITYLDDKVKRYRTQICLDLNILHQTNYPESFWIKALGLGFVRFVHLIYDGYQIASQFDPMQHQAFVLDKESFHTFQDFEEFRALFQQTDFGFEQMFSLYIQTFHPEIYNSNKQLVKFESTEEAEPVVVTSGFFHRVKKITIAKAIKKIGLKFLSLRKPSVGIYNSYFSLENLQKLIFSSWGGVNYLDCDLNKKVTNEISTYQRSAITKNIEINDQFDQFFKAAMECMFPTLFVESFKEQMSFFQAEASKYRTLKYLVCESWIGDSRLSLFIAALQEQGVRHIYNEHNYLQHFFLGNHIEQIKQMCDQYYTLGWERSSDSKIKKGASLFPFAVKSEKGAIKNIKYLYIGCVAMVKMPEINCAYGEQEENAERYINSLKLFFSSLTTNVKSNLVYRPYPVKSNWLVYDLMQSIQGFVHEFKAIDDFKHSSKEQMLRARLVIVDYLSTAYLESLIMNIPTIILFDKSRYFLNEKYQNFFDGLISVGICHENEGQAANFINEMGDDIDEWWKTKEVQEARSLFLEDNIGDPDDAIKYYLSLNKSA